MSKPCDMCHERPAKIHLTRKQEGHTDLKRDVCEVCFPPTMTSDEEAELKHRLLEEARAQAAQE